MGYRASGKLADFGREEPMVEAQRRTVERVGEFLRDRVRAHTPIAKPPPGAEAEWLAARKRVPGTLRESWRVGDVVIITSRGAMRIDVFTHDPVAPYVEWMTRPHLIEPRHPGGVLRFWSGEGAKVFATIVHHPGTQGVHMMSTALVEVAVEWQRIGREEMARWAREQARLP